MPPIDLDDVEQMARMSEIQGRCTTAEMLRQCADELRRLLAVEQAAVGLVNSLVESISMGWIPGDDVLLALSAFRAAQGQEPSKKENSNAD